MTDDIPPLHSISTAFFRRRFWGHLSCYAVIWYILTGADHTSWIIGAPAVLLAGICHLLLTNSAVRPPKYFSLLFFGFFFLRQSFLSGIDVLRRTISPRQLLNPGLIPYATRLPGCSSKVFFANTISLLPGTLSVDIEGSTIIVHTIDIDMPVWAKLQNLEGRIADLFQEQSTKERED